ncbi:MAG: ribonuclease P protein component [Bacteroidales bacterium]
MGKFRKTERLGSRKIIGKLFTEGNSVYHYPFRMVWLNSGSGALHPATIAISVPVRRIRKAVKRNLVKRLVRESYRRNREILHEALENNNLKIDFMIIYNSGSVYAFDFINLKLRELIQKFIQENATGQDIL